mmetsp:Transcript_112689/g.351335  ORF Transcript_112689/g.351335 Transcript_112689/m.351335 type:complete len:357 (+) Transcript_112689:187-1257(+)
MQHRKPPPESLFLAGRSSCKQRFACRYSGSVSRARKRWNSSGFCAAGAARTSARTCESSLVVPSTTRTAWLHLGSCRPLGDREGWGLDGHSPSSAGASPLSRRPERSAGEPPPLHGLPPMLRRSSGSCGICTSGCTRASSSMQWMISMEATSESIGQPPASGLQEAPTAGPCSGGPPASAFTLSPRLARCSSPPRGAARILIQVETAQPRSMKTAIAMMAMLSQSCTSQLRVPLRSQHSGPSSHRLRSLHSSCHGGAGAMQLRPVPGQVTNLLRSPSPHATGSQLLHSETVQAAPTDFGRAGVAADVVAAAEVEVAARDVGAAGAGGMGVAGAVVVGAAAGGGGRGPPPPVFFLGT